MTYSYQNVYQFVYTLLKKIGSTDNDAKVVADVLLAAELRDIPSHGLLRIIDYVSMYEKGRIKANPNVQCVHETPSTAVIDGDKGFGMVVGVQAMNKAIEKAKNCGTGWVSVRNSNHFGIAGYFSMMALEHDMIGIAMTNANPTVAPTFAVERLLGTNPISVSIPAGKYPPFVADFATTPIARGKLDVMHKKGQTAPIGFVQDKLGLPSTDPSIVAKGGAIVPLGGDKEHGSHKGYCMSAVVDIFSALLSGANFGPFVPPIVSFLPFIENTDGLGTGHFFGAMRIDAFQSVDDFKLRMDNWISTFKNAKAAEGQEKVIIPGEPEREMEAKIMKEGIPVIDAVMKDLITVADKYQVKLFE